MIHGVRIDTDWSASPPAKLWSRPIGPGWSSFAVRGDLLYTQEQRGNDEIVACYKVSTGAPVWRHRAIRLAGSRTAAPVRAVRPPSTTIASTRLVRRSPERAGRPDRRRRLVAERRRGYHDEDSRLGLFGIAAGGGRRRHRGDQRQTRRLRHRHRQAALDGPAHLTSYSSPHLVTLDGVMQVLLLSGSGATSVAPADGKVLWELEWEGGATIVQPAILPNGDILINAIAMTGGLGIRRLSVKQGSGGWSVEERWTSLGLKP